MIPVTPEECDAFLAELAALIMAELAPAAFQETLVCQMSKDLTTAKRLARAQFACEEAGALLSELQLHAKAARRFDDGEPIDPRALNPRCAHGVSFSDECAKCAETDSGIATPPTASNSAFESITGDGSIASPMDINTGDEGAGDGDALARFDTDKG